MANEEHLKIIKQGVDIWNRWREENPNIQPDLSEADLRIANLVHANLSNTQLNGAKLTRASLQNADLRKANLNKAELRWARLTQANLTEAKLSFANLRETNFNNATFDKADLRDANLSNATLHSASLNEANLSGVNFSHADLRGSKLNYANLTGAHLESTILLATKLTHTNLNKAELSKAQLKGSDLSYAKLEGANLSGANLYEADLRNAILTEANFSGADFTRATADEHQFDPNQLNNKQREQLEFSVEITVKETASEQTDEEQTKYGEGTYGQGVYGDEEKEDRENAEQLAREVLDGQKRLLAKFKGFLVKQKGVPENEIVEERVWVDEIRPLDLDVLFIREGDKTLAIIEYYFFESSLKQPEREQKLLKKYKEQVKLEGCPAYIACLAPSEGERLVDIYQVTEGEQPVYISNDDFPAYEDLRSKMETKTEAFGGEVGDEDFRNVFRENLITFLITEKKFPRESLNYGIVAEAPDMDLAVAHPDTDDSLAVFDCKSGHYGKPSPEVSESMAKTYKSGLVGIQNPFAYIVNPSEESNEDFVIFEVEDDGTSYEISHGDFPTYYQLLFASPLSDPGRRICWSLTRLAKNKTGLNIYAPCQDYINLQIKKNNRTAAQIHRLNDSDQNIALVIAGYQKDFPKAKIPNYMFEGEVKQLSGYTSKSSGEKNWLEGNLGHKQLKYEAGVYILRPGSLVLNEIENEAGDLLELAKKNAEGDKEQEEIKVSKYGKGHIATIQMDRLSEVDLLGRDRLVGAFAGMFVHTEEVEGFTVALLGDWGEGKSTIMKLIRKSLNEKHPGRFEFATFNAWEYERTGSIAAGLAQEVVNGLIEPLQQQFWERQILRFKFAIKEYKAELWRLAIYSVVAIFFILISRIFLENNTLKGLGLAGGIIALLFLLFKNLPTIIEHPIAIKLETYLKLPNYGKHLGDIPIIQSHLKTLCSLRLVDNKKLIVFIDDLDRCQTDCIAGALDAIRLIISIPNVIVMIGIDYRIAFKAMENYYEKLGDKERDKSEIARDYLGKIIQLPVRLMHSNPEEVRKYVEKRLFPDAQIMEDLEKDGDKDTEGGVIEPSKPKKGTLEAEGEKVGVSIPDDKKVEEPKSVEEILKDTTIERDMFSDLAKRFNFTNPRQLLRLRNSYRFLKVMDSDEKYDREILMKILFWQEFLNNWPSNIKYQCEKSVTKQESLEKIEKPEAKQIVQKVQEDISKIIEMHMYEEIERFVNIVVLPHSEGRILDTR